MSLSGTRRRRILGIDTVAGNASSGRVSINSTTQRLGGPAAGSRQTRPPYGMPFAGQARGFIWLPGGYFNLGRRIEAPEPASVVAKSQPEIRAPDFHLEYSMNTEPESRAIRRYVALDLHKEYVMVGAMSAAQEWVLRPRKVEMVRFREWAAANQHFVPQAAPGRRRHPGDNRQRVGHLRHRGAAGELCGGGARHRAGGVQNAQIQSGI